MPKIADLFKVNYTVIPYDGVSTMDFRFRVSEKLDLKNFIADLNDALSRGMLSGIYGMDKIDLGPEIHNCTPFSAVFIEDQIKIINNNIYIFSYFDNENSVNRYFDLVNYIGSEQ